MKTRSLLFIGILIGSISAFASDADVGSKQKSEIVVSDLGSYEITAIQPMDFNSYELTAIDAEVNVSEFSTWRPKAPAAMFTSPKTYPVKSFTLKHRRARDGLSC